MRIFISIVFLLFGAYTGHSQSNGRIIGKVIDAVTRQPIEYAPVTVTSRVTQKVVNGSLTDATGSFEVKGLTEGWYRVTIEFLGYKKSVFDSVWLRSDKSAAVLGNIALLATGQNLQGVTVTASAPVIENKIDKMVYNAANDITSQGGVALDILKKVPQVNVDIDGNVELQGNSNIRFLINGKPSSVFGNSVTDALAAIPASQVKSIEVITSPGAKYDAQGTGGIINIILKDNKMQGINGSINLSAGTRLENGSANLNIRHNNIGVNIFFSANAQLPSSTPATQDRSSFDSTAKVTDHLVQSGYTDFQRSSYMSGIGFDWAITKKDNITAALSYNHFDNQGQSNTYIQKDTLGSMAPPVISTRSSDNKFNNNSLDWSLGYKHAFKREGQELNILYSASYGVPVTDYTQATTYNGAVAPYVGARSNNPGTSMENNISIDYSHPLNEHVIIETGVKTTFTGITSSANVDTLRQAAQDYLLDPGQSYRLDYNMQVYAAYLSASFPLTSYLRVKAGLRYEYTVTQINNTPANAQTYGTPVPSVTISHDIDKRQFIKLSYTRRIERPDYRDVNPFLNLSDPYNITTGNPSLLPEIGNNFELGYNRSLGKSGNLYIALIERINDQDHKQVTTFYPVLITAGTTFTDVSVANVQNIGTEYNTGMNVSGSYTIKDKLNLRGNAFLSQRHIVSGYPEMNGVIGTRFRLNLNVSYQFPHDLISEIFGNYNSASQSIQGKTPQSVTYTLAFRKQFWHKNASIGLTATNIFNEYTRQVTTVQTGSYATYNVRMLPYRSVGISLTYKFGKLEFKKNKEDDSYLNNPPVMGN